MKLPPQFYLAGGTALALQIGHRKSVDFDFFSSEKLPANLLAKAAETVGKQPTVVVNEPQQLTFNIDGIEITYLYYPFPSVLPFEHYEGIRLLSVKEIACSKAYTLGRRATFKDYVDIYFIFSENHSTLFETVDLASKKYGEMFDPRLFLEQLVYLEDVPETEIAFLRGAVGRERIKEYFENQIKQIEL